MDPESCVPLVVTQFHYSSWPDHGVPADKTSLISFIQRIRRHQPYYNSPPLLVHCSAGVGRTGTFITLDSMIQRMKNEDTLNIFEFICEMRLRRPRMVQTEVQDMDFYLFRMYFNYRNFMFSRCMSTSRFDNITVTSRYQIGTRLHTPLISLRLMH